MKPFYMVYQRLEDSLFLGLAQYECDNLKEAIEKADELKVAHPGCYFFVMKSLSYYHVPVGGGGIQLLPTPQVEQTPPMPV